MGSTTIYEDIGFGYTQNSTELTGYKRVKHAKHRKYFNVAKQRLPLSFYGKYQTLHLQLQHICVQHLLEQCCFPFSVIPLLFFPSVFTFLNIVGTRENADR